MPGPLLITVWRVLQVGLTGGIGSGKSTVSAMLEERGAAIIDADRIVRELQAPGEPVFEAMVEAFGEGIVADSGMLDRAAVAAIVFNDDEKLKQLNGIVHPALGDETASRLASYAETDRIVIFDMPLLVESGRGDMEAVIVVDTDPDIAVERLVTYRGFSEADARARMAKQATRAQRLEVADRVIVNDGDLAALEPQVDDVWSWLEDLSITKHTAD